MCENNRIQRGRALVHSICLAVSGCFILCLCLSPSPSSTLLDSFLLLDVSVKEHPVFVLIGFLRRGEAI